MPQGIKMFEEVTVAEIRLFISRFKESPCSDCGKSYPYYVMDFDHVRGTKRFNISQVQTARKLLSLTFDDIGDEIAKCDVVCSNCHRERTHRRQVHQ